MTAREPASVEEQRMWRAVAPATAFERVAEAASCLSRAPAKTRVPPDATLGSAACKSG